MLPFLEVEHLPSSSSFYSAIVQPLGLRYLYTEGGHFPSVTYGDSSPTAAVFQIRQVVASIDRPLRTSRIVLSAPSEAAADGAYEFALRANPDARDAHPRHSAESHSAASGATAHRSTTGGGGTRVRITDFDGNVVEIIYRPYPEHPSHYSASTIRYTKSTSEEACRILDWNYDVATSSFSSPAGPGPTSSKPARTASRRSYARHLEDDSQPRTGLRRSVTAGPSVYEPAASARENSNGLSAGAVVGNLLGVTAGAAPGGAFPDNMAKGARSRVSREEFDVPSFTRRSTFPEYYDGYLDRKARYVDVERAVEKVRYPSDYPPIPDYCRPPPEYIARYSQVSSPRSREVDDLYDDSRGRRTSSRSRSAARPRSESGGQRDPYGGGEVEYRSYTSSRSLRHPPIVQRSYTYDTYDAPEWDSYFSAKSHRSSSTLRAPPQDPYTSTSHRIPLQRSSSRVTTTTIKVADNPRGFSREGSYSSARDVPFPDSRAASYMPLDDIPLSGGRAPAYLSARDMPESRRATYLSARRVPLAASRLDDGYDEWDDYDDDADSITPSDSISCVGSRRNGH